MQKADSLIRTKLRLPLSRPGLVPRPRLQEQILRGLRGPLTLIAASAGFGKTTLAAACVAACGMPAAWLSLDKNDNQAGRFLAYLIAALQAADPRIGGEAAQLMAGMQPAHSEAVLTSLINDLDSAGPELVLALDDYQYISSQTVHAEVAFLLEHSPSNFHLLIATRSDPPLPLARYRARGQLVELRTADLRFTSTEAAQFLSGVMGLHLDAGSVATLEERTEGWIAGLQMAALSMRDHKDVFGFIEGFSGTNRHILDYLLEEVLAHEPEEVQTFLLHTSILSRLTGSLCDALTGTAGGQEMLENLERRSLFVVPLDDDRRWYRYHHLFADLLQARLYQSGADPVAQLYLRAAEWCEQDGLVDEAVGYALASKNYAQAGELITKYWGPMVSEGEVEIVWSWLTALPEKVVRDSALLSTVWCWTLWFNGQIAPIEAHLANAECAISQLAVPASSGAGDELIPMLPAMVATLRSIVARYHNDFSAAWSSAERALTLEPANLSQEANIQLRSLIFMALASAYDGAGHLEKAVNAYTEAIRCSRLVRSAVGVSLTVRLIGTLRLMGRLNAAEAACREALRFIEEQGMSRLPATGVVHLAMAGLLLERNELEAAEDHLTRGNELGRRSGRFDAVRNAAPMLVSLRLVRGDVSGALAAVEEAIIALGKPAPELAIAELLAIKARILARKGSSMGEAVNCADEAVRLAAQDQGQTGEMVALAAVRVHAAQSQAGEAAALLTRSLSAAEEQGRLGAAIELRILRSLALARMGESRKAEVDLERAFTLAEPDGYVRVFLDEGRPLQILLAQWLAHAGASPLRDYAACLLTQFDAELGSISAPQEKTPSKSELVEPLTPRELEVLSLLETGLSNRQIAEKLFLSEGTVKFYMHAIMEKLGVHSRTKAILIAQQQNLA